MSMLDWDSSRHGCRCFLLRAFWRRPLTVGGVYCPHNADRPPPPFRSGRQPSGNMRLHEARAPHHKPVRESQIPSDGNVHHLPGESAFPGASRQRGAEEPQSLPRPSVSAQGRARSAPGVVRRFCRHPRRDGVVVDVLTGFSEAPCSLQGCRRRFGRNYRCTKDRRCPVGSRRTRAAS